MQSVNVNADEIAVVVEGVGRPHFVVIDARIIPGADDVVLVHDLLGDELPVFFEIASTMGHVIMDVGKHFVDMRHFLQMFLRKITAEQVFRSCEQPCSILLIPFLNTVAKNNVIQLAFIVYLNVNIRGVVRPLHFCPHFFG